MRKLRAVAAVTAMIWLAGCASDSEEELFGTEECSEPVSLSGDVLPIIQANCAIEGCHVTGTGLPDYTSKQTVLELASRIKTRTGNGTMPPANAPTSLTLEEINTIACWVDQGAEDN